MRNLTTLILACGVVAFWASEARAAPTGSVTLDGSFGTSGALTGPNYQVTSAMGLLKGNNLFQSFGTFNLVNGESATFSGPSSVQNILARVTGGTPSSIDGSINSSIAGANLFFLNPAGVMFGGNAQVNVSGSFVVSTANYARLSDGNIFYADINHPIADQGLSSAPVSAFGFLTATPAAISFTDSFLGVNPGQGFHVIGGDVSIDDTEIDAPSGNLTIFSAASAGEVPFSLASPGSGYASATNPTYGNLSVTNASYIDVDGNGGGKVVIRGGKLTVDNSIVSSYNSGTVKGGSISVQASQVAVQNGGIIASATAASGDAGDISFRIGSLTVDGTTAAVGSKTGILSFSAGGGTGSAGLVSITATGAVSFLNGGELSITTNGPGGSITIQADSLSIDNSGASALSTGITVSTSYATAGSSGPIMITVTHGMSLTSGGGITTFSFAGANAADVSVNAGSLNIDGSTSTLFTGVQSEVDGTGEAGALTFTIGGALTLENGGQISNSSFSSARGGDIMVNAGSIALTGSPSATFVTAIQTTANDAGDSGAITIDTTGAMSVSAEAVISADTFGAGAAGNIAVHAGSLTLANSTIGSSTFTLGGPPNTGDAGSVNVMVDQALLIENGGLIDSGTSSIGDAGTVTVQAGSMTIDGQGVVGLFTGVSDQTTQGASGNAGLVTVNVLGGLSILDGGDISSNTFSAGRGADVQVHAGSLRVDGSGFSLGPTGISANSNTGATGNGGSLTVNVDSTATLTGAGEISTTAFSSGNTGSLTFLVNGALEITDGAEVSGGTFSGGASGAVSVHAASLVIDGSESLTLETGISNQANSGSSGNAGTVSVTSDGALIISAGGEISSGTRSTGNGGDVTVQADSLTVENAAGIPHLTGITSETDGTTDVHGNPTGLGGNAGSVNINVTGALVLTSGKIDTDTFCSGAAGNITVHAGTLSIDGSANPLGLTGIFSDSDGFVGDTADLGGSAGTVSVGVDGGLNLSSGGGIGAATFTLGRGGDVNVAAASVDINGTSTGLTAQAFGLGNGGSITVNAPSVALSNGGLITASSLHANAGTILINASSKVTLDGASSITTAASANGGNITLNVGDLVYLLHSQIIAAAGINGGNITIDPQFVVLDDSLISANAAAGQGGNITIITNGFFNNDSEITATGSTDGAIDISAPDLDLTNGLVSLPAALVSEEKRLREKCASAVNHEFSTFIVVGRGGTESGPLELQPDFGFDAPSFSNQ